MQAGQSIIFFKIPVSRGTLEYISVWGIKINLSCKQLVKYEFSLWYDEVVQKYCCDSCSSMKRVKGEYVPDNIAIQI